MIKHVSNKIQDAIQMELFKAKESIKIAVAWFTNELLLQPPVWSVNSEALCKQSAIKLARNCR